MKNATKKDIFDLGQLVLKGYNSPPHFNNNGAQIREDKIDGVTVFTIVGSNELKDWVRNFSAIPSETDNGNKVHLGFYMAYIACMPFFDRPIDGPIIVQGHSQGGAVAQALAMMLFRKDYQVDGVLLWAAPRYGNATFKKNYDLALADKTLHIIRQGDPVPWVPPYSCGYRRVGGDMHYWTIDGDNVEAPGYWDAWVQNVKAWIKYRLDGNLDFASDDYHSAKENVGLYEG